MNPAFLFSCNWYTNLLQITPFGGWVDSLEIVILSTFQKQIPQEDKKGKY